MAPIHDSDIAEERWSKSEWDHYELWEKIEARLRRRKMLWIALTLLVFLMLSSIPIIVDRYEKWQGLSMSRRLSEELNRLRREAGSERQAFRIRFEGAGSVLFQIEKAESCGSSRFIPVRSGSLAAKASAESAFALLSHEQGEELGIPGLVQSFCYDPLKGGEPAARGENLVGFAIIPVKDLTNRRADRISILLLKGASAEMSFE